ncbi:hypothetical protein [Ructibacterium gallinarum]|uniref:Lipoprotein n=1 Tax=Ructibacterium gallinarum TaxID=2779355 RepID=A0A9D5R845_9FIRM|nr:hypothetical protein [Ructibacterium gallinarum]MBE5039069.1 hypothetical protein [Ructibacterium gallinarum]
MKKLCSLLFSLVIIAAMTGCDAISIGMIGGSDGPTNVIVSSGKESKYRSEKEPVKVVKVGGFLYYETGEDNDISGRCGTLDGHFAKAAEKYEIPQNDNESNFELNDTNCSGYQIGMAEDTIEIPIENDWEIFKKLYDPEKDLSQYKFIMKVEGKTEYSFGDAEYIVLTNDLDITANDIAKSYLSSQSADVLDVYIVSMDTD